MYKFNFVLLSALLLVGCAEQKPCQVVYVKPSILKTNAKADSTLALNSVKTKTAPNADMQWMWPSNGVILSKFNPRNEIKKGIEISGKEGAPVLAAGDGDVVYSGNSLRGYGNLIIVRHKKNFLTAYAHNRKNLVKEGDRVVIGQRIAEMGSSGTDRVKLHFEVRLQGKPIDPQGVLPVR